LVGSVPNLDVKIIPSIAINKNCKNVIKCPPPGSSLEKKIIAFII
jgi:hypothetical protein